MADYARMLSEIMVYKAALQDLKDKIYRREDVVSTMVRGRTVVLMSRNEYADIRNV